MDEGLEMLTETARAMHYLEDEVVRRLNEGQWYEQIINEVDLPEDLKEKSYLQPVYGCPTFVVHGILRLYTGWYDGNPSALFPSTRAEIASEVVGLVGSTDAILARVRELKATGTMENIQRALHLVDFVIFDNGDSIGSAHDLKSELLFTRAELEPSYIARNIYQVEALLESDRGSGK